MREKLKKTKKNSAFYKNLAASVKRRTSGQTPLFDDVNDLYYTHLRESPATFFFRIHQKETILCLILQSKDAQAIAIMRDIVLALPVLERQYLSCPAHQRILCSGAPKTVPEFSAFISAWDELTGFSQQKTSSNRLLFWTHLYEHALLTNHPIFLSWLLRHDPTQTPKERIAIVVRTLNMSLRHRSVSLPALEHFLATLDNADMQEKARNNIHLWIVATMRFGVFERPRVSPFRNPFDISLQIQETLISAHNILEFLDKSGSWEEWALLSQAQAERKIEQILEEIRSH